MRLATMHPASLGQDGHLSSAHTPGGPEQGAPCLLETQESRNEHSAFLNPAWGILVKFPVKYHVTVNIFAPNTQPVKKQKSWECFSASAGDCPTQKIATDVSMHVLTSHSFILARDPHVKPREHRARRADLSIRERDFDSLPLIHPPEHAPSTLPTPERSGELGEENEK